MSEAESLQLKTANAELNKTLSAMASENARLIDRVNVLTNDIRDREKPISMRIPCPICNKLHIDEGAFKNKPHHTHACQHCGNVWRPAIINTIGVQFLPGFKNRIDDGEDFE